MAEQSKTHQHRKRDQPPEKPTAVATEGFEFGDSLKAPENINHEAPEDFEIGMMSHGMKYYDDCEDENEVCCEFAVDEDVIIAMPASTGSRSRAVAHRYDSDSFLIPYEYGAIDNAVPDAHQQPRRLRGGSPKSQHEHSGYMRRCNSNDGWDGEMDHQGR
jgi:hypothetical protein